jgi:hypothetical protein
MNLQPVSETFTPVEDQSWLGSETGTNDAKTITLDSTLCKVLYATGIVPSGLVIGKVTATNRWAPYLAAASNGTEVAGGILLTTIDVSAGNSVAARMWHGQIVKAKLPRQSGSGSADADAITDLKLFEFI